MAIDNIMTSEAAETLALRGLQFLASDDERIGFFLNTTGTQPQDLFRDAADPAFLLGVLLSCPPAPDMLWLDPKPAGTACHDCK